MPNPGDFDPAEAIRQQRAAEEARKQREQAEKQRVQTQEDLRRANILKLYRYAEEQLENIRAPIVSEFVVVEKRPSEVGFFRKRTIYHQRETRYLGSWLWLRTHFKAPGYEDRGDSKKEGLVKLRRPRAGYAYVAIRYDLESVPYVASVRNDGGRSRDLRQTAWDPRSVTCITIKFDSGGSEVFQWPNYQQFQIFPSLEDAAEGTHRRYSVEILTKNVTQALDFVATGQLPDPSEYW